MIYFHFFFLQYDISMYIYDQNLKSFMSSDPFGPQVLVAPRPALCSSSAPYEALASATSRSTRARRSNLAVEKRLMEGEMMPLLVGFEHLIWVNDMVNDVATDSTAKIWQISFD